MRNEILEPRGAWFGDSSLGPSRFKTRFVLILLKFFAKVLNPFIELANLLWLEVKNFGFDFSNRVHGKSLIQQRLRRNALFLPRNARTMRKKFGLRISWFAVKSERELKLVNQIAS
jgi:hypothetical protein